MKKHLFAACIFFVIFFGIQLCFANPGQKNNSSSISTSTLEGANNTTAPLPPSSKCIVSNVKITNIVYTVGSKSSSTLQDVVQPGKKVKVSFTVPKNSSTSTFSLVSYKAPYAIFKEDAAHLQEVYDSKTIDVGKAGGKNITLEIDVPNCFFQIDFVKGCVIKQLGPSGTNNFYSKQNRLIAFAHGGTVSCGLTEAEGCTPGYWKNHTDRWISYKTSDKFFTVFDIGSSYRRGLSGKMDLLSALKLGGGGFASLARHATAALLSAENPEVNYTYTTGQIKKMVRDAFKSGKSETAKKLLEAANEKDCPLGGTPATKSSSQPIQGIEEPEKDQLTAYPSPFTDKAIIEFTLINSENYTVDLYDMKGSIVRQLKAGVAKAGEINKIEIDGNSLVEGLYLVRLVSDSEARTVKLLLKKE